VPGESRTTLNAVLKERYPSLDQAPVSAVAPGSRTAKQPSRVIKRLLRLTGPKKAKRPMQVHAPTVRKPTTPALWR